MLAGATAQITFQDVTIINGVGTTSNTRGIIFTDYDGDGDEDIYLTQYGSNILYSYDKDEEEYNDVASEANVNHSGYGYASTLGDYNNDGYIDYMMTIHGGNSNVLYYNEGETPVTFLDINDDENFNIEGGADDAGCLWLDFDMDGDLDIFLVDHHAQNGGYFLYQNSNNIFTDITESTLFAPPPGNNPAEGAGQCVIAADFDNDSDIDIYTTSYNLFNYDGSSYFKYDEPNERYIRIDDGNHAPNLENSGQGVATGDYDNDGWLDIIIANDVNSDNILYNNDGDGTFTDETCCGIGLDVASLGVQFGDFDNDGYLDIYIINYNSANKLFINDGDGTFTDVTANSNVGDTGNGGGCALSDFNDDGKLDIYLANTGNTSNILYKNTTSNSNNYLKIKLEGTTTNRSAINSRIEVTTDNPSLSMIREIQSASGFFSQNSLIAHFGLDTATTADIVIKWLNSADEYAYDISANQTIKIVEGTPSAPANLTITNDEEQEENPYLEWEADNDETVKGYDIYRNICSGFRFMTCSGWEKLNSTFISELYWIDSGYVIDDEGASIAKYKVKVTDLTDKVSPYSNVVTVQGCCQGMMKTNDLVENNISKDFLLNNYPNPFNAKTTININLNSDGIVNLSIYDLNGTKVSELMDGFYNSSYYQVQWDANDFSSGLYFVKLTTQDITKTHRIILLK